MTIKHLPVLTFLPGIVPGFLQGCGDAGRVSAADGKSTTGLICDQIQRDVA